MVWWHKNQVQHYSLSNLLWIMVRLNKGLIERWVISRISMVWKHKNHLNFFNITRCVMLSFSILNFPYIMEKLLFLNRGPTNKKYHVSSHFRGVSLHTVKFILLCCSCFLLLFKKEIDLKACQVPTIFDHYNTRTTGNKT